VLEVPELSTETQIWWHKSAEEPTKELRASVHVRELEEVQEKFDLCVGQASWVYVIHEGGSLDV